MTEETYEGDNRFLTVNNELQMVLQKSLQTIKRDKKQTKPLNLEFFKQLKQFSKSKTPQ